MKNRNEKNLSNKSIKVNAILNITKQCSSILFPFIIYPYISRILGSENFGRVSFANSIVEYGIVFATLGIPIYVVREGSKIRENRSALEKMTIEVFSISLFSMLFSIIAITTLTFYLPRLNKDKILIFILSLNIIFSVIGRDWVNTIYEDYFYVTIRYIIFKILALILILVFVKKPEHFIRYAIITLVSDSGGYIANLLYTRKYISFAITIHLNLKKHLKPLMFLFCSTLAVRIYIQSDITILGIIKTDAEVGVYSLASKIYSVIKSVLNAIIFVTIPRISYYLGNKKHLEYTQLLTKLKDVLSTLIFPCIIGAISLGKNIMLIMGGNNYAYGYQAFDILCVALLFAVFGCYYSQAILIPNKEEKKYFLCTFISAIFNIVLNLFVIPVMGIEGAAITTLCAEFIIMLSCRYFAKKIYLEKNINSPWPIVIGCITIIITCTLVCLSSLNVLIKTGLSIIISIPLYFLILYFGKNTIIVDSINLVFAKIHHYNLRR